MRQAGAGRLGNPGRCGHQAVWLYEVHAWSGLGGHCIPIDPLYLSWKLRTLQYNARFIELASEINTSMPRYWVQKVQDALNEAGKPVKGSRVLVLGVAYKKNVSDLRESPALDIIHLLREKGALVEYHDPHVPSFTYEELAMNSVADLAAALATGGLRGGGDGPCSVRLDGSGKGGTVGGHATCGGHSFSLNRQAIEPHRIDIFTEFLLGSFLFKCVRHLEIEMSGLGTFVPATLFPFEMFHPGNDCTRCFVGVIDLVDALTVMHKK